VRSNVDADPSRLEEGRKGDRGREGDREIWDRLGRLTTSKNWGSPVQTQVFMGVASGLDVIHIHHIHR